MCVIMIGRPSVRKLLRASTLNKHGAGVAVQLKNGSYLVRRSLNVINLLPTLREFPVRDQVWHLRWASQGDNGLENCQPIPWGDYSAAEIETDGFLAHYGTVMLPQIFYDNLEAPLWASDTLAMALFCQKYSESAIDFLTAFTAGSSFYLARMNKPPAQIGWWNAKDDILMAGMSSLPPITHYRFVAGKLVPVNWIG